MTEAQAKLWCWVAGALVAFLPVIGTVGGAFEGDMSRFLGGFYWQSLAYAFWEQFLGVAIIVALLVWFRDRLNVQGPLAHRLSKGSYAVYVFHAPVIVLLAIGLSGLPIEQGL